MKGTAAEGAVGGGQSGRTALRVEDALALVLEAAPPPALERVPIGEALGRALPDALLARVDQPPFDKSAMDGFAHASSLPASEGPWRVVGLSAAGPAADPAGSPAASPLGHGDCVRIMTGAALPAGAKAVQRVEWTEPQARREGTAGPAMIRFTRVELQDNVIRRAENQRAGDLLLGPRFIGAQDIGIIASSGYAELAVARRPKVAVLSTGDELAAPGAPLELGLVYDSNGPQLAAQARSCASEADFLGIVRDDEDELVRAFEEALERCDVLIVSGGVSMGDFDHVPRALARAGVERVFHGVAMKPGKPLFFGTRRPGSAVFGLPGNPVSTFVAFELLVRPHLAARCGLAWMPRVVGARLAASVSRIETDRTEFLPAKLGPGAEGLPSVQPLEYKGSSMLAALAEADCLIRVEIGTKGLREGSVVSARLLRP